MHLPHSVQVHPVRFTPRLTHGHSVRCCRLLVLHLLEFPADVQMKGNGIYKIFRLVTKETPHHSMEMICLGEFKIISVISQFSLWFSRWRDGHHNWKMTVPQMQQWITNNRHKRIRMKCERTWARWETFKIRKRNCSGLFDNHRTSSLSTPLSPFRKLNREESRWHRDSFQSNWNYFPKGRT